MAAGIGIERSPFHRACSNPSHYKRDGGGVWLLCTIHPFFYFSTIILEGGWTLAELIMHPWDPLREVSNVAVEADWITRFLVLLLSLAIFAIAFKAYRKTGSERLKYVLIAFALFAVKWAIKVVDVFVSPGRFFNDASENVFELLILGALFMALFRKE